MKIFFRTFLIVFVVPLFIFSTRSYSQGNYEQEFKHLILISLDGFRYDYLDRGVTPTISKIASEGVRAAYLQPVFPTSTFPNHISIITGLYPTNHGIVANKFIDTITNEFFSIGSKEALDPKWYFGEPFWVTCKKNGVVSASYFWPSSDLNDSTRNPNYFERYDHNRDYLQRVQGILSWLDLPENQRPSFLTLYFDSPDTYGHKNGTESEVLNKKLTELDSVISVLIQGLKDREIYDKTNIIILSDHGMMNFYPNTLINYTKFLPKKFAKVINNGAYIFIHPKIGYEDSVVTRLALNSHNFRFYRSDSLPPVFSCNLSSRLGRYIAIANCGWLFTEIDEWKNDYVASHGYDNRCLEMQGIFVAVGPSFKKSYRSIGLRSIDIYPLLCKLFNFKINHKIDGELINIEHILK